MREVVAVMPVSLAAIEDARRQIAGSALRTPLVRFNNFAAPAEIYLKLENLQPIGSFKIRGAANAMAHLPKDQLKRGVLTASAGNMAQGVAWRARELDKRSGRKPTPGWPAQSFPFWGFIWRKGSGFRPDVESASACQQLPSLPTSRE